MGRAVIDSLSGQPVYGPWQRSWMQMSDHCAPVGGVAGKKSLIGAFEKPPA